MVWKWQRDRRGPGAFRKQLKWTNLTILWLPKAAESEERSEEPLAQAPESSQSPEPQVPQAGGGGDSEGAWDLVESAGISAVAVAEAEAGAGAG